MAEEAETGDVRGRLQARSYSGVGCVPVELGHGGDGFLEDLAGLLVAVVQQSHAQRFGERDGQPCLRGVVAEQLGGVSGAGHGHAVLGFGVIDRVTADHRAPGLGCHVQSTLQNFGHQLHRQ